MLSRPTTDQVLEGIQRDLHDLVLPRLDDEPAKVAVQMMAFHEYAPYKGDIPGRRNGVLISNGQGESTNYALWYLESAAPS